MLAALVIAHPWHGDGEGHQEAAGEGLPILVYHKIVPALGPADKPGTAVTLAEFEAQMRHLHEQGYTALSMDEVMRFLDGEPFPPKVVAIHFDDGWINARDALPVLDRYGFKASFWIIAAFDHSEEAGHMEWADITALARHPRMEVFSHTKTHPWKPGDTLADWTEGNTPGKTVDDAYAELADSKRMLEAALQRPVPYLAWPGGIYNATLVELAEEAGYVGLLTIDNGLNHPEGDPLRIRRTPINGACSMAVFDHILHDGLYRACDQIGFR